MDTKIKKHKNIKLRVAILVSIFLCLNSLIIISLMLNYTISVNDMIAQEAISVAKLISDNYTISTSEYDELKKMDYSTLVNSIENRTFQEDMKYYFNNLKDLKIRKIYILGILKEEEIKYSISENEQQQYDALLGDNIYGFYYLEALDNIYNREIPNDSFYYLDRDKYVYINSKLKQALEDKNEVHVINREDDNYISGYYPINSEEGTYIGSVVVEIYKERILGISSSIRLHLIIAIVLFIITQIAIVIVYRKFRVTLKEKEKHKGLPFHDALTNLLNRSGFESNLRESIIEAIKNDNEVALLVIDIDYFKKFNDLYGYIQGDLILIKIANIIREEILNYPEAKIGRIGGDEYYVFINNTTKEATVDTANSIVKRVEALKIPNKGSISGTLTVSLGGICKVPTKQYYKHLAYVADINLFKVKNKNKNGYSITKR